MGSGRPAIPSSKEEGALLPRFPRNRSCLRNPWQTRNFQLAGGRRLAGNSRTLDELNLKVNFISRIPRLAFVRASASPLCQPEPPDPATRPGRVPFRRVEQSFDRVAGTARNFDRARFSGWRARGGSVFPRPGGRRCAGLSQRRDRGRRRTRARRSDCGVRRHAGPARDAVARRSAEPPRHNRRGSPSRTAGPSPAAARPR